MHVSLRGRANFLQSFKIVDPKTGDEKTVTISVDDGIRPNTSVADLGKLKPVFKKDGTTTAGIVNRVLFFHFRNSCFQVYFSSVDCLSSLVGNSSQVSDGAGAVLLMKRSVAMSKGLPVLGVFR